MRLLLLVLFAQTACIFGQTDTEASAPVTEASTMPPTAAPTEATTQAPTEATTQAPTEATTQVPTEGSTNVEMPDSGAITESAAIVTNAPAEMAIDMDSVNMTILMNMLNDSNITLDQLQQAIQISEGNSILLNTSAGQVKIILVEGNSSDTDNETESGDVRAARRSVSRSASIGGPVVAGGSPGGGVVTTRTYNIYKQYLRRLRLLRQELALRRGNASPLLMTEYRRVLLLRNNLIRRFPSLPRILLYESLTRRSVPTFGRSPGLNLPVIPVVNRPNFLLSSGIQTRRLTQARPLGEALLAGRASSGLAGGFTVEGASGFSNTASNGPDTIRVLDGIMRRLQRQRGLSSDPDIIILPPDDPVMSGVGRVSFSRPTANLLSPSLVNTRLPFQGSILPRGPRQLPFRGLPLRPRPLPIRGVF